MFDGLSDIAIESISSQSVDHVLSKTSRMFFISEDEMVACKHFASIRNSSKPANLVSFLSPHLQPSPPHQLRPSRACSTPGKRRRYSDGKESRTINAEETTAQVEQPPSGAKMVGHENDILIRADTSGMDVRLQQQNIREPSNEIAVNLFKKCNDNRIGLPGIFKCFIGDGVHRVAVLPYLCSSWRASILFNQMR